MNKVIIPKSSHQGNLGSFSLVGVKPKPIKWLVPGYVPLGKLTLFAGDGGVGKSSVTLDVAAGISTGLPCFGLSYAPPPPADVLLIGCEDEAADTVVPRLLAAGADLTRVRTLPDSHAFDLSRFDLLDAELSKRPDTRLVVVDPVSSFIPSRLNERNDTDVRSLLRPLTEVAARRGVAVLLLKHLNKPAGGGGGGKAVHRVGGSVAWVNAVRVAFAVAHDPQTAGGKVFVPLKANILPPDTTGFGFRIELLPEQDAALIVDGQSHLSESERKELAKQLVRVVWGPPARLTADEALADPARLTRVDDCVAWVLRTLGSYTWTDSDLKAAAVAAGFTEDNLKEAKTRLRNADPPLQSKPGGKGSAWVNWIGVSRTPNPPRPVCGTPRTPHTPYTPHTRSPLPLLHPSSDEREEKKEGKRERKRF